MTVRTTNFDAIATSAPLNREASVVRDGSGDLWEAKIDPRHAHWKAPPPSIGKRPEVVPDLAGRPFGRMSVVRYYGSVTGNARWLVRCACGDYELRRSKAILSCKDADHCCNGCQLLKILQRDSRAPGTANRRAADDAMLDRLAKPEVCGDCRSPYTCAGLQKCVMHHGEVA